jgi:hypothetical protein
MSHADGIAVPFRPLRDFPRPLEGGMLQDTDVHFMT